MPDTDITMQFEDESPPTACGMPWRSTPAVAISRWAAVRVGDAIAPSLTYWASALP